MQNQNSSPNDTPPSGAPGGTSSDQSSSVTHSGATELTTDTSLSDQSYSSTSSAENALLVSGATVNLSSPTITKTGDDSGDNSDFYGTNAAVFAYDDTTLNITGGEITTNGSHANAVFAYGTGTINISDTQIITSSNNSGGIMVTGGGTLTATNLTVETSGNSSAPIRSDRGGGNITVTGGTYTSHGTGSPAIYSTADITVKNASLTATASEGIVIEGLNSVILESTTVTDTNTTLNGNSETYKNIFIYQSMSGDAETGTGTFTAKNSVFTTNQGDHFFITNTTAIINLAGNTFINNDSSGAFLRAASGKWGTSGSNGGNVTLNTTSQEITGDIIIDSVSSLDFNLTTSYFKGAIANDGTVNLTVDASSIIVLTGNSYVSALTNAVSDNSNIYANGYTLYVNGSEVSTNQDAAPESFLDGATTVVVDEDTEITTGETQSVTNSDTSSSIDMPLLISGIVGGIFIVAIIVALVIKLTKDRQKPRSDATLPPARIPGAQAPAAPHTAESPAPGASQSAPATSQPQGQKTSTPGQ